ncbi:MAG: hypothetical protein WBM35_14530 [Candidatus Electrothrix sp.]
MSMSSRRERQEWVVCLSCKSGLKGRGRKGQAEEVAIHIVSGLGRPDFFVD